MVRQPDDDESLRARLIDKATTEFASQAFNSSFATQSEVASSMKAAADSKTTVPVHIPKMSFGSPFSGVVCGEGFGEEVDGVAELLAAGFDHRRQGFHEAATRFASGAVREFAPDNRGGRARSAQLWVSLMPAFSVNSRGPTRTSFV